MKKTHAAILSISATLAITIFIATTGCETQSVSSKVIISPDSVTIQYGQSVEFTASGGYDYSWSLSQPTWGTLSTYAGSRVVYTSLLQSTSNSTPRVQTLTVTSTVEGDAVTNDGTNDAAYSVSAEAIITHT